MLVPAPGRLMTPAGTVLLALSEQQPLHAEIGALVDVDFDDDGFNLDLRTADVELVDDRHQGLHDLGRRRNDQRVGRDIRPNGDAGIDIGAAAAGAAGTEPGRPVHPAPWRWRWPGP